MAADKILLRDSLAKVLGWDPSVAEEVVEAISLAQNKNERDDIVQGYLGGGPKVKSLVDRFLRGSQMQPPSAVSDAKGREHRPGERQAGSVTVRHVASKPGSSRGHMPSTKTAPEKEICNCISCGKIYFTRSDTADNLAFVESGGVCTFCGARVALSSSGTSQARSAAAGSSTAGDGGPGHSAPGDQTAAAVAFKDRLVEYDRNARQRTTVVDDQNDFFEIDTNAWLDPEEREQLKRQEKEMQEAEEARRKRVTVTFDLLGRQVLLADEVTPTQQELDRARSSATASAATAAQAPHGGGTSARSAMQAALRIQPNSSLKTERPLFVPTTPETAQERQQRRGVPQPLPKHQTETSQSVVGGWGDEKASTSRGTGLSSQEAKHRQGSAKQGAELGEQQPSAAKGVPSGKKAKKPQLKRLQHDDPFEGVDMLALDDSRPEEIAVQ